MAREKLTPVSKEKPCPVCGGDHKCSVGDGGLIICGRQSGDVLGFRYLKPSPKDPQFHLYRASNGDGKDDHSRRRNTKRRKIVKDWGAISERYAKAFPGNAEVGQPRNVLAKVLGLPIEVLDLLPGLGVNPDDAGGPCWTFPERDAAGTIIGIMRRYLEPNKRKKAMLESGRGLTLVTGWQERGEGGPVYVVEGASDTLALTTAGLSVVGRPSSTGGAELLAELLKDWPADRAIVVLGENDERPSKMKPGETEWPGKIGAETVAGELARRLGRVVAMAMPPDGAKDVREWLLKQVNKKADWDHAGSEFIRKLQIVELKNEEIDTLNKKFSFNDYGNARRLVAKHGKDLRFNHPLDAWYIWNGRRWKEDDTGEIVRRAKSTTMSIFEEMKGVDAAADRAAIAQHALRSQMNRSLMAMINLGKSEMPIPVRPDDLDMNPWIWNCPNGSVDLQTGEIKPHRREDLVTQMSTVPYDPKAECPLWDVFLARVFPNDSERPLLGGNKQLIRYIQRILGYSMTGDIREHLLPIFWGAGSNGKSTLVEIMARVFGRNYWAAAPEGMFMIRKNEAHPTELARLYRKRMVAATETEEGQRLNVSLVKRLTGGDTITARYMRQDFFEFEPTHKLLMCTNDRPRIPNSGHAIWRRVSLIPFDVKFWNPELGEFGSDHLKVDPLLPAKLKTELPGILAWMVRGCLDWQADGLATPKTVRAATEEYRDQQNIIGAFLGEKCETTNSTDGVTMKVLYAAYCRWCEQNGETPWGKIRFNEAVQRENKVRGRNDKNVDVWKGLKFRKGESLDEQIENTIEP